MEEEEEEVPLEEVPFSFRGETNFPFPLGEEDMLWSGATECFPTFRGFTGSFLDGGLGEAAATPLNPLFLVSLGLLFLVISTPLLVLAVTEPDRLPTTLPGEELLGSLFDLSTDDICEAAADLVVGGVPINGGGFDGSVPDLPLGKSVFFVVVFGLIFKDPPPPPTLPGLFCSRLAPYGTLVVFSVVFEGGEGRGLLGVFGELPLFVSNFAFSLSISEAILSTKSNSLCPNYCIML